ncbi:MAG: ribosomal protein [Candidatus Parcubacteria bacterium]|jgi:large subunit ribosomal protein L9
MKVILLRDVAKLGKRGSVIEVPDGYALNKLVPQKMAQPATPENLKRVVAHAIQTAAHAASDAAGLTEALAALSAAGITIPVDANAQDHLFKAVKAADIATATIRHGHAIRVEAIHLKDPIKALGTYQVSIQSGAVTGTLLVTITRK